MALVKQTELFKEPEQVLTCSKMLMDLGAWKEALNGYERFSELAPMTKGVFTEQMQQKQCLDGRQTRNS